MPTGGGPGTGTGPGPTPLSCADQLAAANAELERLQAQYRVMETEYDALNREWWELAGRPSAGRSDGAAAAGAAGVAQLVQAIGRLEGGGGQVIVETAPQGTDPVALLMRRAASVRERIDRLEART